jgi:hypothetical protein
MKANTRGLNQTLSSLRVGKKEREKYSRISIKRTYISGGVRKDRPLL